MGQITGRLCQTALPAALRLRNPEETLHEAENNEGGLKQYVG